MIYSCNTIGTAQSSFTADVLEIQNGKKKTYKLYSDGHHYRYDIEESVGKFAVIVSPEESRTSILIWDKKYVHHTDPFSSMSLMNDPNQAFRYAQSNYTQNEVGQENINGFDSKIIELWSQDQKIYTAWFSPELNFLLKIENHVATNTSMELINIKVKKIDRGLFVVPEDFTKVDEKMRPVIPEPPPPDTWAEKTIDLPFSSEVVRGDRIQFSINYDVYTKFLLSNIKDTPAKVTWYIYRNGQLLPDNEQGPLSYRTKRIYPGENKNLTYDWKPDDKIILECYEGKLHVEIKPEKKIQ